MFLRRFLGYYLAKNIIYLTPTSGAYFEYFWNLYERQTRMGLPASQSSDSFPFLSLNLALQLTAMAALDLVKV